jgi:SAM-dependent methyltransferase
LKPRLLDLVVCPACGGQLLCQATSTLHDDVIAGQLVCSRCSTSYPIRRGIPRLLTGPLAEDQRRTADAFGWEWQEFRRLHAEGRYREQFLDWVYPISPEQFAGKVVLDAGCGMGRFAIVSAEFGARDVLAIDLSRAVEAATENARAHPNVHVIQADIYHLPLARRLADGRHGPVVDFAYSIGVLHHLPDPEGGFAAISQHVKPGGTMFAWVYGRENNEWIIRVVNPIREYISSRLPRAVLYALSLGIALPLQVLLKLLYGGVAPGRLRPMLPYHAYLSWLAGYGIRHNHHVIFDHLVAPTAFYIRRDEFTAWFERAGFTDIALSWRNQNSWRGRGRLPTAEAAAQTA